MSVCGGERDLLNAVALDSIVGLVVHRERDCVALRTSIKCYLAESVYAVVL
jgi:hypothetical protein